MIQCPAPIINLPPAPENHDWLKTIVAAVLGLLAGLIAEPIKGVMSRRLEVRRIVNALYLELAMFYSFAESQLKFGNPAGSTDFSLMDVVKPFVLERYQSDNQKLFLEEKVLKNLEYVYTDVTGVDLLEPQMPANEKALGVKQAIDKNIATGMLNGKRLFKLRKQSDEAGLQRVQAETKYNMSLDNASQTDKPNPENK